jgi:uncharacterized repeat protein (TIGR01451 family)
MLEIRGIGTVLGLLVLSTAASAQLQISTSSVPAATQYQSYSTALTASGGTPPYTWSVNTSSGVGLPEGMSLNPATGVVSATQVNGQGGFAVTIQVTDSASPSHNSASATLGFGVYSDTSLAGCQMFPADSIFNQRVDRLPVDTTPSDQIPASYLSRPLHPDFGHGFYPDPGGIPWMRVPANQPATSVYLENGGQIDSAGTYRWPFPAWPNALIEGTSYGTDGSDHHTLILQSSVNNITGPQTGPCILYETYNSAAVPDMFDAGSNTWSEYAGIHYALNSDEIAASPSTLDDGAQDSPGIPMVPLLLRYSEVPELAQHPLRITFPSPTNGYVWPATGCCSGSGPPQGLLYRLKASVNWQATCPVSTNPQAATVLQTLQQYGAYMSDHGSPGFMQGVPDIRWNDDDLACIKKFTVGDLEVVDNSVLEISSTSGQTRPYVAPATLASGVAGNPYSYTFTAIGGNPTARAWTVTSGALPPGLVLSESTGAISGLIGPTASGPYNFQITAKDTSSGYSSAAQAFSIAVTTFTVTIQNMVAVTVTSVPAGLKILVDGSSYTTPQVLNWLQGSSHTLSAPSPQGTGTRYPFAKWSDGGTATHTVVVPATPVTYSAAFTTQYLLTTNVSPANAGKITLTPAPSDEYYSAGTVVKVTAIPEFGKEFVSFSGALTGKSNPQNVTMSAPTAVTATFAVPPALSVSIKPTGTFTKRETNATFTIVVSDTASTPTTGTVTVSEMLPPGMSLVSMAGSGWTCPGGGSTCTRSDSLDPGDSYPAIAVTADIANNAGALLLDWVMASGGGAAPVTTLEWVQIRK